MIKYSIFSIACILALSCGKNKLISILSVVGIWVIIFSIKAQDYGVDIVYYYKIFLEPNLYEIDEPGLKYLNEIISFISKDYIFFSFCYAVLINASYGWMSYNQERSNAAIIFIFFTTTFTFYQINLNIYRQGLSIILFFLAVQLFDKNKIKSLVLFSLSLVMHKAIVLGIGLFFISGLKIRNIVITLTALISIFPIGGYVNFISDILIAYVPIFERTLVTYNSMAESGFIIGSSLNHRNIPMIIVLGLIFLCNKYNKINFHNNIVTLRMTNIFVFSLLAAAFFSENVLIYDRIILYTQILYPVLFFIYLRALTPKYHLLAYCSVILTQLVFTVSFWGPRNDMGDFKIFPIF